MATSLNETNLQQIRAAGSRLGFGSVARNEDDSIDAVPDGSVGA